MIEGPRVSLVGRERYEPEYVEDAPPPEGMALPAPCLRRLQLPQTSCMPDCPGRQRDGGCCADLVRNLEEWKFTISHDGFWEMI